MSNYFQEQSEKTSLAHVLCLLVALIICASLYFPNANNHYFFDDIPQLAQNPNLSNLKFDAHTIYRATLSGTASPTGRPVAMLTFALESLVFGTNALISKRINIFLHLICGYLSFLFLSKLFRSFPNPLPNSKLTAGTIAAIWLIHPIHVSTVLYSVQRMTILANLFSLIALISYIQFRLNNCRSRQYSWMVLGLATFLIAILAKENAIAIVAVALIIELLTNQKLLKAATEIPLFELRVITLVILVTIAICSAAPIQGWLNQGYDFREFTLLERLITEPAVILHYVREILAPSISSMGFFQDSFPVSKNIKLQEVISILVLGSTLYFAIMLKQRSPVASFGLLYFLVGHSVESTILPLEIAFEHRNYAPSLGLIAAFVVTLGKITEPAHGKYRRLKAVTTALIIYAVVISALLWQRTNDWKDYGQFLLTEARNHPSSFRANLAYGEHLLYRALKQPQISTSTQDFSQGLEFLRAAATLSANRPEPLFGIALAQACHDNAVQSAVVYELERRLASTGNANIAVWLQSYSSPRENCGLPAAWVTKLFEISLDNENIPFPTRTEIALAFALHAQGPANSPEKVEVALVRAADLSPKNVRPHLYLGFHYAASDRRSLAIVELERADELDITGRFASDRGQLRSLLFP